MDLHRIAGTSDWATIEPAQYNFAQKIASSTKGILTPGNLITLVGFLFVVYGLLALLDQQIIVAATLLIAGRLLDIADGFVAHATKTKSSLGEIFDATIDKLCTVLTIGVLLTAMPSYWWLLLLIVLPHIVISIIVLFKRQRGVKLHPTRSGKISMALVWITLIGIAILNGVTDIKGSSAMPPLLYILGIFSSGLGFYSTWQYLTEKT